MSTEPVGLIARLRSEAYRIAEYGLQRDHSMAADELERWVRKCRVFADALELIANKIGRDDWEFRNGQPLPKWRLIALDALKGNSVRELPVNLPDIPVQKTPLPVRLMTHADSMQSEGWYTTANVMAEAADELKRFADAASLADVRLSEENDALIEQNKELLAALESAVYHFDENMVGPDLPWVLKARAAIAKARADAAPSPAHAEKGK